MSREQRLKSKERRGREMGEEKEGTSKSQTLSSFSKDEHTQPLLVLTRRVLP